MKEHDFGAQDRLTFTGGKPGSAGAGMSVQLHLNKHTGWAGVDDSTTNVSGIALWLSTHGDGAAQRSRQQDRLLQRMFTDQNVAREWID